MNTLLLVTLPLPPSANQYWKKFQGSIKPSPVATLYKRLVAEMLRPVMARVFTGPVRVRLDIFRAPATHANLAKQQARDLDNNIKVLADALQGCVYENDSQVFQLAAEHWDHEPHNPRVQVAVEECLDERVIPPSWEMSPDVQRRFDRAKAEMEALAAKNREKAREKRKAKKEQAQREAEASTELSGRSLLLPGERIDFKAAAREVRQRASAPRPAGPSRPKMLTKDRARELATPAYRKGGK